MKIIKANECLDNLDPGFNQHSNCDCDRHLHSRKRLKYTAVQPLWQNDCTKVCFLDAESFDRKYRVNSSVCTICNKRLSNQYNLRVHMETHAGRRHACRACSHVSRSRDALRKHVAYRHARADLQRSDMWCFNWLLVTKLIVGKFNYHNQGIGGWKKCGWIYSHPRPKKHCKLQLTIQHNHENKF